MFACWRIAMRVFLALALLSAVYVASASPFLPSVLCPDGSQCAGGDTCCTLTSGSYGCCPLPNAVCCSDHLHCCPEYSTCDVSAGTCSRKDGTIPFFTKVEAKKVGQVVCPDGSQCADGDTCCMLTSGSYGCCPLPNAVCCSDHLHCCPEYSTCDVSAGTCSRKDGTIPFFTKVEAKKVGQVVCPDGSQCADGDTCCMLTSGSYGCCPFANAVCCSDHLHCCPEYSTCDVSAGTCSRKDGTIPFFTKVEAKKVGQVVCPDGNQCADGDTCCMLTSGKYGCCPLPKAVCCSDHLHCCPNGYKCDVSTDTCTMGDHTIPFLTKVEAKVRNVICPDGSTQCADGQTCCQLTSGKYGCCPLAKAVCCSDHLHCCPNGYKCDVSTDTCTMGDHTIPFLLKQPPIFPPKKDQWL